MKGGKRIRDTKKKWDSKYNIVKIENKFSDVAEGNLRTFSSTSSAATRDIAKPDVSARPTRPTSNGEVKNQSINKLRKKLQ